MADVRSIFLQIADLAPSDRAAWFDQQGIPAAVRDEVESLLRFDTATGHPLTDCVSAAAGEFIQGGPVVGKRYGAYRLTALLGSGGMGAVFLAERQDGEVRQQVAIKFVRHLAPHDRFLRERQVLASLNHPGIARLLDAGRTAEGQPYMVMEYVEGTPLDVYCRPLDIRSKLALFLQIADALAYAHRNLVIHRDLKPANILVDAAGRPKLLDFGIARMLDDAAPGATTELILTPEYASPEQIRGCAHTTATDIYSLGAVLYQLLAGRSPHAPASGTAIDVEKLVSRSDPPPPSQIDRSLPRDLDFIVAKAMRPEPEERYAAVDAMADDIRAFLESRPVRARAGSTWYRTRKFLRRHWLPVASAAAVIALLAGGLFEVSRERNIAQHRFQQLQQLANQVLEFDSDIRILSGATKARQKIVSVSLAYLDGLGREAHNDPQLSWELAYGYDQLAKVQGVPGSANLGQLPEAEASLGKAENYAQVALHGGYNKLRTQALAAEISQLRMIVADTRHREADSLAFARQTAARLEEVEHSGHATDEISHSMIAEWINVANALMNQHHFDDAVHTARRAVDLSRRFSDTTEQQSMALSLEANALRQSGDLDAALQAIGRSRALAETLAFPTELRKAQVLYSILWRQGQILDHDTSVSLGRADEAMASYQRAYDLMEDLAIKDPADSLCRDRIATAAQQLADVLRHRDPRRALDLYDHAIQRQREVRSIRARRAEARLLARSAYPLDALHRPAEAGDRIAAALHILQDTKDYPAAQIHLGDEVMETLLALAGHQAATGDLPRALATGRDLLDKVLATGAAPDTDLTEAANLSRIYESLLAADPHAADIRARRQAIWTAWNTRLPHNIYIERQLASVR